MAIRILKVYNNAWTEITTDLVDVISFQNLGGGDIYVGFSETKNPPVEDFGHHYAPGERETKASLDDLTFIKGPARVFARATSGAGTKVLVETP